MRKINTGYDFLIIKELVFENGIENKLGQMSYYV